MTLMFASVTGPEEALAACAGRADVIDVVGAAGVAVRTASLPAVDAVIAALGGRCATSAAAGDLSTSRDALRETARDLAASGVDYIKIAIPTADDAASWLPDFAPLAASSRLLAVFFADAAPDLRLVPRLAEAGFVGVMIDTQEKAAGRLLDHMSLRRLHGFVAQCHQAGLLAGLAGSLQTPDIPRLLVLAPDMLGFRGALCGPGNRSTELDPASVQAVRALIPARDAPPAFDPGVPVDRILVEDVVLPVSIGAYSWERDATQRVRFAVTASVLRTPHAAEDMRDVFSYDLITDGIRMIVESGHFAVVETLAERIAAMVLAHRRVTKVVVRVQKLETGMGIVGVEIERGRAS
jgi:dihydroneopterin aldolase